VFSGLNQSPPLRAPGEARFAAQLHRGSCNVLRSAALIFVYDFDAVRHNHPRFLCHKSMGHAKIYVSSAARQLLLIQYVGDTYGLVTFWKINKERRQ
jgi:hypothetical protein